MISYRRKKEDAKREAIKERDYVPPSIAAIIKDEGFDLLPDGMSIKEAIADKEYIPYVTVEMKRKEEKEIATAIKENTARYQTQRLSGRVTGAQGPQGPQYPTQRTQWIPIDQYGVPLPPLPRSPKERSTAKCDWHIDKQYHDECQRCRSNLQTSYVQPIGADDPGVRQIGQEDLETEYLKIVAELDKQLKIIERLRFQ